MRSRKRGDFLTMNSAKFDGKLYPVRETEDLRDIIMTSVEEFADKNAYLIKKKHGEPFQPVTYRETGEDIKALGTRLIDMGLKGEKIGVIGETSYEWLITYFATVCGVGVIVPLDKKLPPDELKSLVERSGIKAIVYSQKEKKQISALMEEPYGIEYFIPMKPKEGMVDLSMIIDEGKKLIEKGDRRFLDAKVQPDDLSTLMFTSGTTGMAKGVMLSQRNIAANVKNMSKCVHLEEDMVILSILPVHHAYAMTCVIWTTFFQGKTIAICEGIRYIQKNMAEVGAGCMVGVPLVFEKMYKGMWKQAKSRGEADKLRKAIDFSRKFKLYNNRKLMQKMFKAIHRNFGGQMKLFIAGGAAIDPKVIEDFEAMGIPMIQGYGMSENAPIIAVNQDRYSVPASVGRAMPETQVRIINKDDEGVGEVCVRGPSVMLGYYGNPQATDDVIVDGWLHTGDLGYMDEKGFLYLTGRKKTVIVTKGGKNIYPEEIETVLLENELVQEVLVHGVTDKNVGNTIIAADIFPNYTLLKKREGDMNSGEVYYFYRELVDRVNDTLPPYKIIKRVNIRETEFSKTTTGKIKRYGNFTDASASDTGKPEIKAILEEEKKHAEKVMETIRESSDHFVRYRDGRPVTDVKHMFTTSADLYGKKTAFIQKFRGDEQPTEITYTEALADVNGLGTALLNRGMKGKSIGVIGQMCYQWCTAYLAVTGGVGTVVPMDTNFQKGSIERIIKDSDISCIFCDREFKGVLENIMESERTPLELIVDFMGKDRTKDYESDNSEPISWKTLVAEGKNQVSRGDRQFMDAEVIADDMAAIHYTSGSQGRYKGVMFSNTAIVENLMEIPSVVNLDGDDVIMSVIPGHHSFECTCGFLIPLYRGASIAIASPNRTLEQNLCQFRPTVLMGTPFKVEEIYKRIVSELYKDGNYAKFKRKSKLNRVFGGKLAGKSMVDQLREILGGRLRMVISAGDKIDPGILEFMGNLDISGVQGYGLTEFGPLASINPDNRKDMKTGSAGHILPGTSILIEGENSQGVGEICLKSNHMMMGYYKAPEETDDIIINGWLHTGDIGYIDKDEFIFIQGRRNSRLRLPQGQYVYPESIEASLRKMYYIKDAMVWKDGREDGLTATVQIDREAVEEVLEEAYRPDTAIALIGENLHKVNRDRPEYCHVKNIVLRDRDFEKTTGGKLRRDVLANRGA